MTEMRRCSACGVELSEATSAQGLCPNCLLKLGLSDPSMAGPAESQPVQTAAPAPPPHRLPERRALSWKWLGIAGVAAGLVLATFALRDALTWKQRPPDQPTAIRFNIYPPAADFERVRTSRNLAISPDGRQLAYVAT